MDPQDGVGCSQASRQQLKDAHLQKESIKCHRTAEEVLLESDVCMGKIYTYNSWRVYVSAESLCICCMSVMFCGPDQFQVNCNCFVFTLHCFDTHL